MIKYLVVCPIIQEEWKKWVDRDHGVSHCPGMDVARVLEIMTGGQGRKSNPPLAASTSMYLFNLSAVYSRKPSQTSKQKTRRNGFTSYMDRITWNSLCWENHRSLKAPFSSTMTTSENTDDVMVRISSTRKLGAVTGRREILFAVISRDRSDLFFDRSKSRRKVSLLSVGWWVR